MTIDNLYKSENGDLKEEEEFVAKKFCKYEKYSDEDMQKIIKMSD